MQSPYNNEQHYQMPSQGYQQPMQSPSKKKAKWPWLIGGCGFLVVLAICGIIAASAGIFNSAAKSTVTSSTTTGNSQSTSTNTIAKVGQTITVDNVSCTLVSIKNLEPDDFNQPKTGYHYIVATIIIKNTSTHQTNYNPFDFHIKSNSGNVTDADLSTPQSYTSNNILNSGSLDPNGTVNGDVIMQAPLNDPKAELTWAASFFGSTTQYGWVLGKY